MLSERSCSGALIALSIAYALFTLWQAPGWTVDDAYILFRYARTWLATGIPTWNPGEPPVEGYTGTLYLALLTAGHALGIPLPTLAKLVGIASYGAAGIFMLLLLQELRVRPLVRAGTAALYFSAAFLFPHALSGLETMVWVALLSASVWLTVRLLQSERVRFGAASATFGIFLATALVRPEGVLFALSLTLALILRPTGSKILGIRFHLPRTLLLSGTGVFLVPFLGVNLWRWHLYGELLPNTYFAKQASGLGWAALLSFLEFALQYWAVALLIALLAGIGEWERWTELLQERYGKLFLLGLLLAGSTAVLLLEYSRSTLQMNYAHRFWAMLYPLGLCLAAAAAEQGFRALEATSGEHPLRLRRVRQLAIGLLILQLAVHGGLWRWGERKFLRDYQHLLRDEHAAAAAFLRRHLPPDSWIVVYPDAGLIPFLTGFRTLDGGRLNDRFLARHHWSGTPRDSLIVSYIFARSPAAFVFKSRREDRLLLNAEAQALVQDARFRPYVLAASFRTRARRFAENYFLLVYVHRRFLPQGGNTPERAPGATAGEVL
ncbi:hypothetical protein HRbin21_01362 [bacterium HR21]|nr:hypothetical protein HRbin21_01362 [bacterium HR21]